MPLYWIPLPYPASAGGHVQPLQLSLVQSQNPGGLEMSGKNGMVSWCHQALQVLGEFFVCIPQPSLPWACTVREEGAKTVARLASQRAKDNPYFMKILPTARSTPSWLLCISRDTERCLDPLASFWASYKIKAIATAGERIQHTDTPQILQIFCIYKCHV